MHNPTNDRLRLLDCQEATEQVEANVDAAAQHSSNTQPDSFVPPGNLVDFPLNHLCYLTLHSSICKCSVDLNFRLPGWQTVAATSLHCLSFLIWAAFKNVSFSSTHSRGPDQTRDRSGSKTFFLLSWFFRSILSFLVFPPFTFSLVLVYVYSM